VLAYAIKGILDITKVSEITFFKVFLEPLSMTDNSYINLHDGIIKFRTAKEGL
jgi:hypothetical protein